MMRRALLAATFAAALLLQPVAAIPAAVPASAATSPPAAAAVQGETALQSALRQDIEQRKRLGLPVPDVQVSYRAAAADPAARARAGAPLQTIKATTTIRYDGPAEAGLRQWPALRVAGSLPDGMVGTLRTGDFTQDYRAFVAKQVPGAWDTVQFGQEPRTRVIEETITLTPGTAPAQGAATAAAAAPTVGASARALLGFNYTGPKINNMIAETFSVEIAGQGVTVGSFRLGYALDWGVGMRLPFRMTVSAPSTVTLGSPYQVSTSATPVDWGPYDYMRALVATEKGNEWVWRGKVFAGLEIRLLGVDLCPWCHIPSLDENRSASFTPPLGAGQRFPVPAQYIPVTNGRIDIPFDGSLSWEAGFALRPDISSSRMTANWRAVPGSDCTGQGTLTFTAAGVPVSAGPLTACNLGPTDRARAQIADLRYWFNRFDVAVLSYVRLRTGSASYAGESRISTIDLTRFGQGLSLGRYVECTWDLQCRQVGPIDNTVAVASLAVDRAAPTTSPRLTGTAGSAGWYRSDVTVALQAADNPAGCGVGVQSVAYAVDGGPWRTYSGPFTVTAEGTHSVSYRATDTSGNVEGAKTLPIKIDKTPPTISGAPTTAPNAAGWYRSDITVRFTAADALSGVASVTPDQVLTREGRGLSVAGRAVDVAGNTATTTVAGLNLDKTAPTVAISSPAAGTYANTDAPVARWTVSDALSGVAAESATFAGMGAGNGQPLDLLLAAPGPQALTVSGTDRADNVRTASVTISVTVDAAGLRMAVDRMCEVGWISKAGTCSGLGAKARAAAAAIDRGSTGAAANQLGALLNEIDAQVGKSISPQAAEVLRADVGYLLAQLRQQ